MAKRMLIDAAHTDETRVAIVENNRIFDYDFVTSSKTQLKGNIYLAKITRVEPSLQAAFVEYGGGKQGFLPFSEIHPDYYQIPQDDRKKLLEEQIAEAEAEEAAEDEAFEREQAAREARRRDRHHNDEEIDEPLDEALEHQIPELSTSHAEPLRQEEIHTPASEVVIPLNAPEFMVQSEPMSAASEPGLETSVVEPMASAEQEVIDATANAATSEDADASRGGRRGPSFHRRYRIQEVIKRNQIVLVQVIKEERGNKGASLTTYISLAGRSAVLMPNSPRGGGISRKITDRDTRRGLKEIAAELRTHKGMSVIIRTAGLDRTKEEIRRDFDYLAKLWNQIREDTLKSTAPALIYEEGNLIKRALRDLYTSDIQEILIEGEAAYTEARDFVSLLMPGQEEIVRRYESSMPIFASAGIEEQLLAMTEPQVRLPSGGYIVINPTEALISIDVNSGRSTTERNVEETAVKTNLEAAREVARQLRLRDLAGLIVIDFIDMNYGKNRKSVERAMKDALRADRAKTQMGRISMFGLMELSRQRLRPSMAEAMGVMCPHCRGTGYIHSVETVAIQIIRTLEKEAASGEFATLRVTTHPEAALHLLNEKRQALRSLEERTGVHVVVLIDPEIVTGLFRLIKVNAEGKETLHDDGRYANNNSKRGRRRGRRGGRGGDEGADDNAEESSDAPEQETSEAPSDDTASDNNAPRERGERGDRHRRGGRGRRDRGRFRNERFRDEPRDEAAGDAPTEIAASDASPEGSNAENNETGEREFRNRGRRGGRGRRDRGERGPRGPRPEFGSEPSVNIAANNNEPYTPAPQPTAAPAFEAPPAARASASVIPLSPAQTDPTAIASPIHSESAGDANKPKRKGWWSKVLE